MNKPRDRIPTDPRRKARFREIARGIVAKDRSDRKYGLTIDTTGAIAQALERAYRDGVRACPSLQEQCQKGSMPALSNGHLSPHAHEMPFGISALPSLVSTAQRSARAILLKQPPSVARLDGPHSLPDMIPAM